MQHIQNCNVNFGQLCHLGDENLPVRYRFHQHHLIREGNFKRHSFFDSKGDAEALNHLLLPDPKYLEG